jgi:hypothetical protein
MPRQHVPPKYEKIKKKYVNSINKCYEAMKGENTKVAQIVVHVMCPSF